MDSDEFLKPESVLWHGIFQVGIFLMILWVNRRVFLFSCVLPVLTSLFTQLFIHSAFLLSLRSHILLQNCFASLVLSYVFVHFSSYLLVEFSFVVWNVLFCLYSLTLSRYLFVFLFSATAFWFISCIIFSNCVALLFSSLNILVFLLSLQKFVVKVFLFVFPVWFPIQV